MSPPARERAREWGAVAAAFVAVAVVAGVWLARDGRPPEWDHANHLERSVLCARDLADGDTGAILRRSSFYPPLVPCAAGAAWLLVPTDAATGQAVILGFLALGMVATYLLGRRAAGGGAGVAAAVLFAAAPYVVFSALRFQLDLPLAALVALALAALLATDGFRAPAMSVAVGVVLGLGMLTKPSFPVYVLVPLAWSVLRVRSRAAAVNAALALVVTAALALPWYGRRVLGLSMQVTSRSFRQAAEAGHPDPMTWSALLTYPRAFATDFGVLAVILFVAGTVVAVRRRQWLILAAVLVPFAAFELIQNKNPRYTLPLLPLAAVVAGIGASALPRRAHTVAGALIVAALALQVSATAFGRPAGLTVPVLGTPIAPASPPDNADWRQREILAAIARDSGGAVRTVSVVPNHPWFSVSNFRYYAVRDGAPLRFTRAWDGEPLGVDYMLVKSGDVGPWWTADKPRRIAERLAADADLARVFPVIGEYPLPDGSVASLRVRRVPGDLDAPPAAVARAVEAAFRREVGEVARDVEALAIGLDFDDSILQGRVRRVEITAASATFAEFRRRDPARLRMRDVRIVFDDVLVNPFSAWRSGHFDLLDVGQVRLLQGTVSAPDLQAFLRGLPKLRASVSLEDGWLAFALVQRGPDVSGRVRIVPAAGRPFAIHAQDVWIGPVPLPAMLVDWVLGAIDPSEGIARRLPFPATLAPVQIGRDAVRIGG